jgi:Ca2+-binding RTX toxin-like protein
MTNTVNIGNSAYTIGSSSTTYVLGAANTISGNSIGISESKLYSHNTIDIKGTITSPALAYDGIDSYGSQTTIHVESTGNVGGAFGLYSAGVDATIINDGIVQASTHGIYSFGGNANIVNNGTVSGAQNGIAVFLDGVAHAEMTNAGTVNGIVYASADDLLITNTKTGVINGAVDILDKAGQKALVTNEGLIDGSSGGWAFDGREGNQTVVNHGTMFGMIDLGAGNDLFDNRGGVISSPIAGGAGNDTFIFDTAVAVKEAGGGGIDTVKSSVGVDFSLALFGGQELENLVLLGTKNIDGTGNAFDNVITGNAGNNTLNGKDGVDVLTGAAGNDKLNGGAGVDTMNGGTGIDTMKGGDGNDTYYADRSTDKAIESNADKAVGGTDRVNFSGASGTFKLGANIENLTLDGSKAIGGTGNSLANSLAGNSGNNTLKGMAGNDMLSGGKGADVLTGGTGSDTFIFKSGFGKDVVTDFENGKDHFDFKAWSAIGDFTDLKEHYITVSGHDLIIRSGSDSLTLKHTAIGELDAGDFLF